MVEVKLHPSSKGSMEQRIRDKLKPSSSPDNVTHQVSLGTGPTRVHHTVHGSASQSAHGPMAKGENLDRRR